MRRGFGGVGRKLARFIEDRSGNFAVITAAIITTILLSVGFGVNTAQMVLTRSNLQNALDSAVTSTARDLTTGAIPESDAKKTINSFLKANGGAGFASIDNISLDTPIVDHTAKTVTATASVNIRLVFPFFGASDQKIAVKSAALYSDKKVEVAMILDTTGSMKGQKIEDLKSAAENAVEALLKNETPNNKRVRVALVPYAEAVNVGALAESVYAESSSSPGLPPVAGSPLLVSRTGSKSLPPYADYLSIVSSAYPKPDTCATERKDGYGNADFSADSPDTIRTDKSGKRYYALINRDNRISLKKADGGEVVGTDCPTASLIPLTDDKQKLLDAIKDISADGVTAGGIAAQWGYYMLSPKWRQVIRDSDLGDGPANYNAGKITKVAILMTDGQFNTAFAGVPDNKTPQNRQGGTARSNAESICTNMKRDGIEVFTIGFALPSGEASQARDMLKNCSSPDKSGIQHFFDVSTGPELNQAFQDIIANTERVALTQ